MKIDFPYGLGFLNIDLPTETDLLTTKRVSPLLDEHAALFNACRRPIASPALRELVMPGNTVAIVHSDITRPTPNDRILPVLLAELEGAGVARCDIVLLNALGTHRPQTDAELRGMLGHCVVDNYRCEQHNCFDATDLVRLGTSSFGNPIRINRRLVEADVRILTGFIEPHFFAGFSGGPKAVLPAMAGEESVLTNHGRLMISHPHATWGVTHGNPIWEEMCEAALMVCPTFLLNVTLDSARRITGVFAGDMLAAHAAGCEHVRQSSMVAINEPYDIVVTTNGGYPLDQNLYQCVKGMSAANRIVREGGDIVLVAECGDGLPDHGRYAALLKEGGSPQGVLDLIAQPGLGQLDQWAVQIQAKIQSRARVHICSGGLTHAQVRDALCTPCPDVSGFVKQRIAEISRTRRARVAAVPEGPQTIAYLAT